MTNQVYQFGGWGTVAILPQLIQSGRSPQTTDILSPEGNYYQIGQQWFNTNTEAYYVYNGSGIWVLADSGAGALTQVTGNTGTAVPSAGNLNIVGAGSVSIAATGSTLTISVSGEVDKWTVVTTNTPMVAGNAYFSNGGSQLTFTLPVTSAVGDDFRISAIQSTFTIVENSGQQIRIGAKLSTATSGTVTSTALGDSLHLVCAVANTLFVAVDGPQGNFTVV